MTDIDKAIEAACDAVLDADDCRASPRDWAQALVRTLEEHGIVLVPRDLNGDLDAIQCTAVREGRRPWDELVAARPRPSWEREPYEGGDHEHPIGPPPQGRLRPVHDGSEYLGHGYVPEPPGPPEELESEQAERPPAIGQQTMDELRAVVVQLNGRLARIESRFAEESR